MADERSIESKMISHAHHDTANVPQAAQPEPHRDPIGEWIRSNHAEQPSLWSEIKAMAREAVKDVRQTMNEVFFSKGEHAPEPGTPLNPTQQVITAEMGNFHGYGDKQIESPIIDNEPQKPSYSPVMRPGVEQQDRDQGMSR